jgi:hypothetical protein
MGYFARKWDLKAMKPDLSTGLRGAYKPPHPSILNVII